MTTVVYRNRVLATDSRTTNKDDERRRCHSCGDNVTIRDDSTKITLEFGNNTYNGEQILAIAQCGVRGASIKAISLIKEGKDIKQYLTMTKDVGGFLAHTFSLIIVTTKNVWVLSSSSQAERGYREKRYELTDYVAEGSGKAAAKLAMAVFDADAVNAVRAASLVDPSSGGDIKSVEFDKNGVPTAREVEKELDNDEAVKILKALCVPKTRALRVTKQPRVSTK